MLDTRPVLTARRAKTLVTAPSPKPTWICAAALAAAALIPYVPGAQAQVQNSGRTYPDPLQSPAARGDKIEFLHDVRGISLVDTSQLPPTQIEVEGPQILQTAAAFGQVSYEIVSSLQLQAGLRYTHDWNETPGSVHFAILGIPGLPALYEPIGGIETDSATTGKVALNWTVNQENFLYAFVAKGFKGGGFNPGSATTAQLNFAHRARWQAASITRRTWSTYPEIRIRIPRNGRSTQGCSTRSR